ncbi:hypothetical protein BN946_scf185000.g73 [Trametes cinnabarina]|uniref:Uncharacterized protein n=1 Tax=Pycnoporus cinnabarinus TaxID=5643 RepID=A0A060S3P7_PYCCI|nr:hypothetical protein BN946_scf185000.g73 [Trametes cinnabarina]
MWTGNGNYFPHLWASEQCYAAAESIQSTLLRRHIFFRWGPARIERMAGRLVVLSTSAGVENPAQSESCEVIDKVMQARKELACALARATNENQEYMKKYQDGSLRVPEDVKELMRLCKQYRKDALQHQYDGQRLAEYILRLRAACLVHQDLSTLPPLPDEIAHVLNSADMV